MENNNKTGFIRFFVDYDNNSRAFWDGKGGDLWEKLAGGRDLNVCVCHADDARAYMDAFESCDGWDDGNYRAPHPLLFQALPTTNDVIRNCVDLYADYAWDAYSEDRTDDPIDVGLYIDDDGDAQIDDNCSLFAGYVCSITLTGLTKYDSQRDDETREEFLAAARPVIRGWIEDQVRDAWDNVLELQNYRYPENVPEV